MGLNYLIPSIIGIVMFVTIGSQVVPSYIETNKIAKVENITISNQELLRNSIERYIKIKGTIPTSLTNLKDEGFIKDTNELNELNKLYSFSIDKTKGILKIFTKFEDENGKTYFQNNLKYNSKPTWNNTNQNFETQYLISDQSFDTLNNVTTPTPETSSIPKGVILMWSGSIASIPTGYALCNGLNGTPDLRNKFVIGSSLDVSTTSYSNIEGINTKSGGNKDAIVVSHTHTGTANASGAGQNVFNNIIYYDGARSGALVDMGGYKLTSTTTTNHTHTLTINNTGSSGTNANLPPYYALAFIMKL